MPTDGPVDAPAAAAAAPAPPFRAAPALAGIVALAFATRLGACLLKAVVATDAYFYVQLARAMLEGRWTDALGQGYHPAYPFLSAAFSLVLRDLPFAAHAVSIVLGALTAVPAWAIGRRLAGERGAFVFALLVAVHPEAVDVGSDILVEATFLFFFLSSVALFLRAAESLEWWAAAAAGACAGAAYLTRPEGLAAAAIGALLVLAAARWFPPRWPRRLACAAILSLAFAAAFVPYVLWLRGHTGRTALTAKSGGEAFTTEGPKDPGGSSERALRERASGNPLYLPWVLAREYAKTLYKPFLALLALLAFPAAWRRADSTPARRVALLALAALLALYMPALLRVLMVKAYISTRHLMTPALLFLAVAAGACARLTARHRRGLQVATVLIAAAALPKSLRPQRTEQVPLKQAGLFLRDTAPGAEFAGPEKAAYYAGVHFFRIPGQGSADDIADNLRNNRTPWIVVLEEDNPGVADRLARDPRFVPVRTFGEGADRVMVFRLSP